MYMVGDVTLWLVRVRPQIIRGLCVIKLSHLRQCDA